MSVELGNDPELQMILGRATQGHSLTMAEESRLRHLLGGRNPAAGLLPMPDLVKAGVMLVGAAALSDALRSA